MRCPMCLGKGYATDEDIKEYPNRCQNCNGKGFYSVDFQMVRCEVCNGSGKKPQTNEEWFCGLSTEEKAKWLNQQLMYATAAREQGYFTVDGLIKWLKEKHE